MRHLLSLLLENHTGTLSRVAGLFSARAFNIESLTVAATEDPTVSRMTLVTSGSPAVLEQIVKQLNKLIDVIKVVELSSRAHVERELLMLKLRAEGSTQRAELKNLTDVFRGRIVDVTDTTYVIELTGTSAKLDAFIEAVETRDIIEAVRTGVSGIARGEKGI